MAWLTSIIKYFIRKKKDYKPISESIWLKNGIRPNKVKWPWSFAYKINSLQHTKFIIKGVSSQICNLELKVFVNLENQVWVNEVQHDLIWCRSVELLHI